MLLTWSSSQGLNALMNSAEFIAGFADKGSGEVDLTLAKGTGAATFTRATTATTVNSAGLIVSVASGTPRSYYDPTTLGYRGYLAEGARTNLCLQSNAFTTTWTNSVGLAATQNQTGPDGATSAWTMTGTGTQTNDQAITLTATTHTASIYVKKTTGATGFPVLECFASPLTALCTIDTNNGIATVWTAKTGGWTIVTSSATCVSAGNFWRVSLTFLATAASWTFRWYPCTTTNATQSTGSFLGATGTSVCYGAQLEAGSFASSYIPTTTASVTRNADVLTYPFSGNASSTVGTAFMQCFFPAGTFTGGGINRYLIDFGTNAAPMFLNNAGSLLLFDGTATRSFSQTFTGASSKIATSWGGSTSIGSINGGVGSSGFDGDLGATTAITIGDFGGGSSQPFCTIRNVRIYQTQLSAAQLQAVTA